MNKPLNKMTVEELRSEYKFWDKKIKNATVAWGAAISVADEFRTDCKRELQCRGVNP